MSSSLFERLQPVSGPLFSPPAAIRGSNLPLRDQRVMVGTRAHATVAQVEEAWQAFAVEHGGYLYRIQHGDHSTDLRRSRKKVTAYVSANCWTADCPECNSGIPTWPPSSSSDGNPYGCCLGCGTVYRVTYPAEGELAAGVEALLARPTANRHWQIHEGETAAALRAENITNGFHPVKPLHEQEAEQLAQDAEMVGRFLDREGDRGAEFLRGLGYQIG